jgi:Na+/proline symporter
VFTAYEYLGQRFDSKTRLLGAALFLTQRGIGAALTIYAPAIVLSSVFGWSLSLTIICTGLVCVIYTVIGGSDAVRLTQKYQLGIIFIGMIAAFFILLAKMPAGVGLGDALALAGGFHKLLAVDFSPNLHTRYTFWSGTIGGFFLALSYFGTDQSQVQRYISGASLREGRLGLMFHAICKIPMQFFILLLGVLLFVFYQFEPSPLLYARQSQQYLELKAPPGKLRSVEADYASARRDEGQALQAWLAARHAGDFASVHVALIQAQVAHARTEAIRLEAGKLLQAVKPPTTANEADYVFITFILNYLPHGLIGLLVAAFFAAALSSKAAELNALASSTMVDFYRHLFRADEHEAHYVLVSKCFTAFWGLVAIVAAVYASLVENIASGEHCRLAFLRLGGVLGRDCGPGVGAHPL